MAGGAALQALQAGLHEDVSLEIVIPAARAAVRRRPARDAGVRPGLPPADAVEDRAGNGGRGDPRRWLTGPVGRELVELAGPMDGARAAAPRRRPAPSPEHRSGVAMRSLDDAERRLLQLLTEGRTNAEIAAELDLGEDDVAQRLARLQARLGTSSRAEATSLAFRGLAAVGSR